jgi:hypothetical protein
MKNRLSATALFLAVVLAATTASAEMKFMNDGQSGFGLGAAYVDGEDYSGFGGTANYTVRGSWDLGLDVSWLSLDEETNGTNASATAVTPWFALGLVRPKEASKFGAELKVGYEMDSFSSDVFDELDMDMSGSALIGAASLYMRLESSPTMLIYPEVSLGYMTGTLTIEEPDGTETESDLDEVVYGASVSFLFNQKVRVTPAFMSVDDNSTWALTLGLVMPGS